MTQRGTCPRAAGPKRDARADAPRVEQTEGSYRLPAAPLSLKLSFKDRRFCDPASRQVCLCQRSAGRSRSTHLSWTDIVRVSCVVSPSRRHRRPVRREPSIDTHTPGTRANLSHIADITRRARVSPAMNSSPIRDVRTKSRQRLSDLCHMRDARKSREKKEAGFPAPLTMTTEVYFVFFLATAITCAQSVAPRFALRPTRA